MTEIVQHEIHLLTSPSGLNHIGHVDNTGEDRSFLTVNREVHLYRTRASR